MLTPESLRDGSTVECLPPLHALWASLPTRVDALSTLLVRDCQFDYRDVGEDFRATLRRSGITTPARLTLHSFRHGYASLLISAGLNVVYVSRQLGHANPSITLTVYAHLYAQADHAASARAALDASHTALTATHS